MSNNPDVLDMFVTGEELSPEQLRTRDEIKNCLKTIRSLGSFSQPERLALVKGLNIDSSMVSQIRGMTRELRLSGALKYCRDTILSHSNVEAPSHHSGVVLSALIQCTDGELDILAEVVQDPEA